MKLRGITAALALALGTIVAGAAHATVIVGNYSLDSGVFGGQLGVHSTGSQTGVTTASGFVNQDGSAVTFTSTGLFNLAVNGQGEATIVGDPSLSNLTVSFAKQWGAVTFDLESDANSAMSLLVNGTSLFSGGVCGSLCDLSKNGSNKFVLTGPDIQTLTFNFDPCIADAKQFRLELPGASLPGVPEPATWGLMIVGVFAVGAAMRLQRRTLVAA